MSVKRLSEALHASKEIEAFLTNKQQKAEPMQKPHLLHQINTKLMQTGMKVSNSNATMPQIEGPPSKSTASTQPKHVAKARIIRSTRTSEDKWGIYSLAYKDDDGFEMAAGFGNGAILLYDTRSGSVMSEVTPGRKGGFATMSMKYSRSGEHVLSTSAGGDVAMWKTHHSKQEPVLLAKEKENEVNCLDICRDGTYFATGGKDRHVRLYDTSRFKLCSTTRAPNYENMDSSDKNLGHTKRVFALKFHPQENHILLTGGWDDCVKIWDKRILRTAKRSLNGPHICGNAIDVQGNLVLTGSWTAKNALQLWDLRMGCLSVNLPFAQHNVYDGEFLYCAKFADKTTIVAGGSGTNSACTISTLDMKVKNEINLEKPCYAIDTCRGGTLAVIGGLCDNIVQADLRN